MLELGQEHNMNSKLSSYYRYKESIFTKYYNLQVLKRNTERRKLNVFYALEAGRHLEEPGEISGLNSEAIFSPQVSGASTHSKIARKDLACAMAKAHKNRHAKDRNNRGSHQNQRSLKRKRDEEDLAALDNRVRELDVSQSFGKFSDLPISQATASGLDASHFQTLTAIQQKAIPLALQGSDILGAAKTGSGKTLGFLIPVLETLVRKKWTEYDGLGALILSPTRELAVQIFDVLRDIGRNHTFSAGLVIGGKSLQEERERLGRMNILVCTPGRMLQHMDQTSAFETENLQVLVLDEADRILDMGFQSTVDAIVEHLPKERQTLLFSATQTKKVSDLARLSLRNPEYISVHETAITATPETLKQNYVVTPLPQKLDTLWSFLRSNLKTKILVFLSSGKQVRFVYQSFCQMRPGIQLLHLHGRQKQGTRLDTTTRFSASKNACLFSTDVAARGLDFPAVDWVVQLDCPEDADTYIHRVGRTARFEREGRAVMFLDPSEEEAMLKRLKQKKVPIEEIKVRQKKQQSIQSQLQNMCFKDPALKFLGQKAFTAYVKSIHLQKDRDIFDVHKLPLEEFATSLGLPGVPRIKFQKGEDSKRLKNAPHPINSPSESGEDAIMPKTKTVRTKYDRMFERQNQDILSSHYAKVVNQGEDERKEVEGNADDDGTFFNAKRRLPALSPSPNPELPEAQLKPERAAQRYIPVAGEEAMPIDSKRREKLLKSKKKLLKYQGKGSKLVFDDQGNAHEVYEMRDEEDFKKAGAAATQRRQFVDEEQRKVREADIEDKQVFRDKRRAKKEKRKLREKEDAGLESRAILAPFKDDEGEQDNDSEVVSVDEAMAMDHDHVGQGRKLKRRKKAVSLEKEMIDQEVSNSIEPENLEDLEALATSYL